MAAERQNISLTVSYRGTTYPLALLPDSTLAYLHDRLEELTAVRPENQKLIYKGKKTAPDDAPISDAGIKDGAKVQLVGPTAAELGDFQTAESEHQRKERILRERAARTPAKVSELSSPSTL